MLVRVRECRKNSKSQTVNGKPLTNHWLVRETKLWAKVLGPAFGRLWGIDFLSGKAQPNPTYIYILKYHTYIYIIYIYIYYLLIQKLLTHIHRIVSLPFSWAEVSQGPWTLEQPIRVTVFAIKQKPIANHTKKIQKSKTQGNGEVRLIGQKKHFWVVRSRHLKHLYSPKQTASLPLKNGGKPLSF